ncbi:MAG: GntR family transcriptional regulator [Succinivibrio sp.]|nr:GntR family transcriptional regulator [Succinivibrio sp.]
MAININANINEAAAANAAAAGLNGIERKKSSVAYQYIKKKIIENSFAPGRDLSEEFLVKELGMSRTPIRDATKLLEKEGFLNIYPNRGIVVRPIDMKLVEHIFTIRELNEPYITAGSIGNLPLKDYLTELRTQIELADKISDRTARQNRLMELDSKLHWNVLNTCDNPFILSMMSTVYDHNDRIRIYTSTTFMEGAQREHLEIINYILSQDTDGAKKSAKNHVFTSFEHIVNDFYKLGNSRIRYSITN